MPNPLILVPRPAPHLAATLAALQGLPMLAFAISEPQPLPITIPTNVTGLILTSRIGVPTQNPQPSLPTYCVGGCTAKTAEAAGFKVVYTGTNSGQTMAADIAAMGLPPQHFLHLHGDHAGTTWYSMLQAAGHTITPLLAYRTNRIHTLPSPILAANPTHILLFSAGSAQHLANLYKNANIPLTSTALCLSPAVAQVAASHWPQVKVANQPTLAAMAQLARTTTK